MKNLKQQLRYEDLIILLFKQLIDIYGVDIAIIFIYKINSERGVEI